jgi:hypothetical protein
MGMRDDGCGDELEMECIRLLRIVSMVFVPLHDDVHFDVVKRE